MTDQERDYLRSVQDRVISKLEQRGISEHATIENHTYYGPITINDLRSTLYPKLAERFTDYLRG